MFELNDFIQLLALMRKLSLWLKNYARVDIESRPEVKWWDWFIRNLYFDLDDQAR